MGEGRQAAADVATARLKQPVRVVLEGAKYEKERAHLTGFVNVAQGAAAQQSFHLTFSVFQQATVPGNYTALK